MTNWVMAAEGSSFSNLQATIEDMELPKGAKVRVVMETRLPWVFDMAGAELVVKPFVPEGMDLVDVWGEGNTGIIEMEADPAWFLAVLAFIKVHWLAITLAGIALWALVSFIQVMVKMPPVAQIPIWLIAGALGGILLLGYVSRGRAPPK